MRHCLETGRKRVCRFLAVVMWMTTLSGSSIANTEQHAAALRPVSVTEQIRYCQALIGNGEDEATLRRCFGQAARLLEDGIRNRREAPQRGPAFEQQLESGAKDEDAMGNLYIVDLGGEIFRFSSAIAP